MSEKPENSDSSALDTAEEKVHYTLAGHFSTPDKSLRDAARARAEADGDKNKAFVALPPLAFAACLRPEFAVADDQTFISNSVEISPVVHPLLNSVLVGIGATRRGERTYSIGIGRDSNPQVLEALVVTLPGVVCYPESMVERLEKGGVQSVRRYEAADELSNKTFYATELRARWTQNQLYRRFSGLHPNSGALASAQVILNNTGNGQMYAKICTAPLNPKLGLIFYPGAPNLDLYTLGQRKDPLLVSPEVAVALLEAATRSGYDVFDPTGTIAELRAALSNMVVAQRVPAAPGEAQLVVGRGIKSLKGLELPPVEDDQTTRSLQITTAEVGAAMNEAKSIGARFVVHTHVAATARMGLCKRTKIAGLRPYQNDATAVHLATEIGYVNACSPGLGKTVIALAAMRQKALLRLGWRGVVVCPAAILTQWARETARFFPEARVETPAAKEIGAGRLLELNQEAGNQPMLVIISYDTVRRQAPDIGRLHPDDLVVDEAAILKNPGSERTKALWSLRKHCGVGIALTGTPIERGLDDLGRILAWARDDEHLFHGLRLSTRFDVTSPDGVQSLWRAIGPCVFRRDRSEIADELPIVQTETVLLDPTPEELALADGARRELKRIYVELQEKMDAMVSIDPNNPDLQEARDELAKARGAALGGITLARMAASDPQSVAISDSAGALLLDSAGLVQPALKNGGTKRTQIVNLVSELAENGEAVLIFTDFAEIADHLADDLSVNGVHVAVFKGGQSKKVRDAAVLGYQGQPCEAHTLLSEPVTDCPDCIKPTLDCLVLTQVGREGLNFQRTTCLIHYDLPWMPSQVVQRVARASRFGAGHKHLSILVPVMTGTIEERVAAVLVPRAVIALAALDTHRGVKGSQTDVGLAIGGIEDAVSAEERKGQESIFEIAKGILGD